MFANSTSPASLQFQPTRTHGRNFNTPAPSLDRQPTAQFSPDPAMQSRIDQINRNQINFQTTGPHPLQNRNAASSSNNPPCQTPQEPYRYPVRSDAQAKFIRLFTAFAQAAIGAVAIGIGITAAGVSGIFGLAAFVIGAIAIGMAGYTLSTPKEFFKYPHIHHHHGHMVPPGPMDQPSMFDPHFASTNPMSTPYHVNQHMAMAQQHMALHNAMAQHTMPQPAMMYPTGM